MKLARRPLLEAAARGLASLGIALVAGCGAERPPEAPAPSPLPPLRVGDLGALLPAAGLTWGIRARPREIAQIAWLIPTVGAFAPEARLDRFANVSGFDLRQAPESWFAGYDLGGERGTSEVQLVRHNAQAARVARAFSDRLSGRVLLASDRPDLERVSGTIGTEVHAFARLGPDVALFQRGGDPARGPARVLAERATGRLAELPGVTGADPLAALLRRFGAAPLVAFAPGPFEAGPFSGDAARLLTVATAVGVALRPTAREGLGVAIAVLSDFGADAPAASEVLSAAWRELAASELGRMLALDAPREAPIASHTAEAVALQVELAPEPFARGLHALLEQDLDRLLGDRAPR